MKSLLAVLLALGYLAPGSAAQQTNPLEQGATIWFYRPIDSPSPREIPMLFEIGGITRQLARLAPGEFFGYSVPPGIHVFSYTRAPSRGESSRDDRRSLRIHDSRGSGAGDRALAPTAFQRRFSSSSSCPGDEALA